MAFYNLVTGNEVRARLVVIEWQRLAAHPLRCRVLAFRVSVALAEFMTDLCNPAGLPAVCVIVTTPVA